MDITLMIEWRMGSPFTRTTGRGGLASEDVGQPSEMQSSYPPCRDLKPPNFKRCRPGG